LLPSYLRNLHHEELIKVENVSTLTKRITLRRLISVHSDDVRQAQNDYLLSLSEAHKYLVNNYKLMSEVDNVLGSHAGSSYSSRKILDDAPRIKLKDGTY
jgi:hypothetical protein